MRNILRKKTIKSFYRAVSIFVTIAFVTSSIIPPVYAQSLPATVLNLPLPGTMVPISPAFTPALIKGLTVYPDNPLKFDFIIDHGDNNLQGDAFQDESITMVKYFLAALTVPEDELWVNLSPYEGGRIVSEGLGDTIMGSDMLAQDYLLKQLTASLMYPEDALGHKFWERVHAKVQEKFGTTEIPTNTFNKVWIVPEDAAVYVEGMSAFVISSKLKVMLEEDYLTLKENQGNALLGIDRLSDSEAKGVNGIASEMIREVLIPEIEKEVNQGENFAKLRQIFNSLILAAWYKQNLKDSLLGQVYVDQNKTRGVDTQDKQINQKIYDQYLAAFKTGVYNYIKEDYDPATQDLIPRKYFSGGVAANKIFRPGQLRTDRNISDNPASERAALPDGDEAKVTVRLDEFRPEVDRIAAWMRQDRFKRIHPNRIWTPEEIANIRGTVEQSSSFQNRMARKLYNLMAEMDAKGSYVATGGVMDGPSAAAMAEQGQRALYLSGWQVSDWWGHPDLAKYPLDTVPNVVADINKYLQNKDQAQQIQIRKLVVKLDKLFLELFRTVRDRSEDELETEKQNLIQKFVDAFSDNDLKIFVNAFRDNADARLNELFGFIVDQAIAQKNDTSQEKRNLLRQAVYSSLERELIDYLIPIYADGDTGHNSIKELMRLFVKAGAAGVHIEDQDPACKKCGHMNGKVVVSTFEHYKRLLEARKEADKLGSEMVIIARTDADDANLLTSNIDPRDHYFIMGTTNERLLSLADLIRLTRRETMAGGTADEVMSELEANFPDLAQGVRQIWRLRGEADGRRLDFYDHLRLADSEEIVGTVQDLWDSKEAIKFGETDLKTDTVLQNSLGRQLTVQEVLDREPVNIDEEINATYQLTGLWNNHAQLKIYPQAVADQIQDEGQRNAWKEATDPLKVTLSHDQMRALALKYGVSINWNAGKARTYEGFYQIDSNLGIINASVRARVFAQIADNVWMEQAKPDAKEAEEFARNVDADPRAKGVFKSLNLSPSFNWLNPNNWKSALTAEQIVNIRMAMAQPGFDWNNSATWGASYASSVQAMVDAIREFSARVGKAGFGFQFVTVLQDHVMTRAMANAARGLVEEGMGHYVFNTHAQEHKTAARFFEHQWHAGVERVTAENDIIERGSTSTGPKGGTDTQFQRIKPASTEVKVASKGLLEVGDPNEVKVDEIIEQGRRVDISRFERPDDTGVINPQFKQIIAGLMELYGDQHAALMDERYDRLAAIDRGVFIPGKDDLRPGQVFEDAYGNTATIEEILAGGWEVNPVHPLLKIAGAVLTGNWSLPMAVSALSGRVITPEDRQLYNDVLGALITKLPETFTAQLEKVQLRKSDGALASQDEKIRYLQDKLRTVKEQLADTVKVSPVRLFTDFQDASKVHGAGTLEMAQNVSDIINGRVTEVTRKTKEGTEEIRKVPPRDEWPVIMIRVADMEMNNRHITYKGKPVPEIMFTLATAIQANQEALLKDPNQIFSLVFPKLESPEEVKFVIEMKNAIFDAVGVPKSQRPYSTDMFMNETIESAILLKIMMWAGRGDLAITNVGRWDKGASDMRTFMFWLKKVYGDLSKVGMFQKLMDTYVRQNIGTAQAIGAVGEGGMRTAMPSEGYKDPQADRKMITNIVLDVLYEWLLGYNYGWVATPSYTPLVQALYQMSRELQPVIEERPYDQALLDDLLAFPEVPLTREELKQEVYEMVTFQGGARNTAFAIAIDSRTDGSRQMFDGATALKISNKLWSAVKYGAKLTGTDTPVTMALIREIIDEVVRETLPRYQQFWGQDTQNELAIARMITEAAASNRYPIIYIKQLMDYVIDIRDPRVASEDINQWLEQYNAMMDEKFNAASSPIGTEKHVPKKLISSKIPLPKPDVNINLKKILGPGGGRVAFAPFISEARSQADALNKLRAPINAYTVSAADDKNLIAALSSTGTIPVIAQYNPSEKGSDLNQVRKVARLGANGVSYTLTYAPTPELSQAQINELKAIVNEAKAYGLPTIIQFSLPEAEGDQARQAIYAVGITVQTGAHLLILRQSADDAFSARLNGLELLNSQRRFKTALEVTEGRSQDLLTRKINELDGKFASSPVGLREALSVKGEAEENTRYASRDTNDAEGQTSSPVGGIDLDPSLLNMQIKRDSKGIPLPLPQQPIQSIHIEGLLPVIINVTPVNLPLLLGGVVNQREGSQDLSQRSLDPIDHKARLEDADAEEVTLLN